MRMCSFIQLHSYMECKEMMGKHSFNKSAKIATTWGLIILSVARLHRQGPVHARGIKQLLMWLRPTISLIIPEMNRSSSLINVSNCPVRSVSVRRVQMFAPDEV